MDIRDLTPGRPVEISIIKNNTKNEKKDENNIFISSLFDITSRGDVVIHMPSKQGKYVLLPLNIRYFVVIYTNVGIYQFEGTLTKQGKLENFPVLVIRPETSLQKVQRREFYRFNCHIPVKVYSIEDDVALLPNMELIEMKVLSKMTLEEECVEGAIVDISGGGARFRSKMDLLTDEYIYMSFVLETPDNKRNFKCLARKVVSEHLEDLNIFEHRVEFVFKDSEDRETIIKYIFDEDRRIRKKDLG